MFAIAPSIVVLVEGHFRVGVAGECALLSPGEALFVPDTARLEFSGEGRAFVASDMPAS